MKEKLDICLHGAPAVENEPAAALAVAQLIRALSLETDAAGQLNLLSETARGDPAASSSAAIAILRAAAMDEALGANLDGARAALRARSFMSAFSAGGDDFIRVLMGQGGEAGALAATQFSAALDELTSRNGLIEALKTGCACAARVQSAIVKGDAAK